MTGTTSAAKSFSAVVACVCLSLSNKKGLKFFQLLDAVN